MTTRMYGEGEKLEGVLERVLFYSEDNNYTVAQLRVEGLGEPITVVGHLAGVKMGETIFALGSWVNHKKFGRQFRVDNFTTRVPATTRGIERYLASGLIRGIGPVMARRMVEKFGTDTLNIIEQNPHRLAEVEGIGDKRIEMITKAWGKHQIIREVMLFLQGHDISATYAERIYRAYGGSAISRVKENPYCLATDIAGIGFKTADRVARSLGIPANSPKRAGAGVLYLLFEATDEGNLFLPLNKILDLAHEKLDIERDVTERAIKSLASEKRIVVERAFPGEEPVYLASHYLAERRSAEKLKALALGRTQLPLLDVSSILRDLERENRLKYTEGQKEAVQEVLRFGVLIITGGPGTGKTTLIRAVVAVFLSLKMKVILTAPTGRAARRLSDAAGLPAKTVHRLLEYNPARGGFQKDSGNPIHADVVIVDEASMVDIPLFYHLVRAIPPGTRLVMVGDVDQLPSVGPGNLLRNAINADIFKVVALKEIFRQARGSMIVLNSHRINQGLSPLFSTGSHNEGEFFFVQKEEPEQVLETIKDLCANKLPARYGFNSKEDIQVISPMNRGEVGTWNLNLVLQKTLNPDGFEINKGGRTFRRGDKVMQLQNNYEKDIYNGDLGIIIAVDNEEQKIVVDFDSQLIDYFYEELDELSLAYAISVHKSQGSEYPAVVMPLVTQHFMLLQRNLLYTAVSRAKKLVVLVGTKKAMGIAIKNDRVQERFTHFMDWLKENPIATPDVSGFIN